MPSRLTIAQLNLLSWLALPGAKLRVLVTAERSLPMIVSGRGARRPAKTKMATVTWALNNGFLDFDPGVTTEHHGSGTFYILTPAGHAELAGHSSKPRTERANDG